MNMNPSNAAKAFRALILLTAATAVSSASCVKGGFQLDVLEGSCNFTSLLKVFTPFFKDPVNSGPGCTLTAEAELILLLGQTSRGGAEVALHGICKAAFNNQLSEPFEDIPGRGIEFIREFFNGGTEWNEQYATMYPAKKDGNESNVLENEAYLVRDYFEGQAASGLLKWPDYISPNFGNCQMNSAYCCWR
jgi:hypothetical protein